MAQATSSLYAKFPVFARHEGVWQGTYKVVDTKNGQILDQHDSKLTCKMSGDNGYYQKNEYAWSDGRVETREFPGEFCDGALCFDTPRLLGKAYEVNENTICLLWTYKDQANWKLSEIITLESDTHRCRTWQHFENGGFVKITVIDEHKMT